METAYINYLTGAEKLASDIKRDLNILAGCDSSKLSGEQKVHAIRKDGFYKIAMHSWMKREAADGWKILFTENIVPDGKEKGKDTIQADSTKQANKSETIPPADS